MKLHHLSFAQLHRLQSPDNLIRVTSAYHKALRVCWKDMGYGYTRGMFFVLEAEKICPSVSARYKPVLTALRSPELKTALRKAADAEMVPASPAFKLLTDWNNSRLTRNRALVWAHLIVFFCSQHGVPAKVDQCELGIWVGAESIGVSQLHYRTGLPWKYIKDYCAAFAVDPWDIFWWVPRDYTGTINPLNRPVATLDVADFIPSILY